MGGGKTACLYICFAIWFLIDTLFFTIDDAPFLRARQMWAFPLGVYIANNKESALRAIKNIKISAICFIFGIVFLALTQMHLIKSLGLFINNLLSLFTVVSLAISAIGLSLTYMRKLFSSRIFKYLGIVAFELYLVQNFSRRSLNLGKYGILLFIVTTVIGTLAAYAFDKYVKKLSERFLLKGRTN